MSLELLVEVGTEEIPATMIPPALEALRVRVGEMLEKWGIHPDFVNTSGTPRRLVLHVGGLPAERPRVEKIVTGPPRAAAFDAAGQATKAGAGFARAQGVDVSELFVQESPKGAYVAVKKREGGELLAPLLQAMLPPLILGLPFRKSMKWGSLDLRFARPIQWIVSFFGDQPLPLELAGVKSGTTSEGLRFFGPRLITVSDIPAYFRAMADAGILLDAKDRQDTIRKGLHEEATRFGGIADHDDDLLEEVANLVESPRVILGRFDAAHLELPPEIPVTVMKHHQRYFPVWGSDGKLQNSFLQVINNPGADPSLVIPGNERVLRARLSDGAFFWREDRVQSLDAYLPRLGGIIYHARLGTTAAKVERIRGLAGFMARHLLDEAGQVRVERAATLCKGDLVTRMVGEFPELQGRMGMEYALRDGEDPAVALAILEHYWPVDKTAPLPTSLEGAIVAMADRMDAVVAFHTIDLAPTGASDPFALRRASLGILRIYLDRAWNLPLSSLVDQAFSQVDTKTKRPAEAIRTEVMDFFRMRLRGLLQEEGIPTELVDAVLGAGFDFPADAAARARALHQMAGSDAFQSLLIAFKRAMNITKDQPDGGEVATAHLSDHGATLRDALYNIRTTYQAEIQRGDYPAALAELLTLKGPVDAFFDHVLVMDPDPEIRLQRLSVLHRVAELFRGVADFTRLSG